MKKLMAASLLLCLAAEVFAIELSAGGGMTVGSLSQTAYYEQYIFDTWKIADTTVPFGFQAYFDATYGMAAIGFTMNGNTHTVSTITFGASTVTTPSDDDNRSGFLSFSLLGRYPFTLGPVSIFPLAGIEFDMNLYWKDVDGNDLKASLTDQEKADLNRFWFTFGVGSDIGLYKGLYVRPLVLLGFKLLNAAEQQDIQDATTAGATVARKTDFLFEGGVQVGWRF
jgi:hypothetical protein